MNRIARERELVKPPPTLASLEKISAPALIAMVIAGTIAVLDGLAGDTVLLIGLLAIPPVIAAMSAVDTRDRGSSAPFCVLMALLSASGTGRSSQRLRGRGARRSWRARSPASGSPACAIDLLPRAAGRSEILAEAGRLIEDDLDQAAERASTSPSSPSRRSATSRWSTCSTADGSIVRRRGEQPRPRGRRPLRRSSAANEPDRCPDGPHPVAEVIRTGAVDRARAALRRRDRREITLARGRARRC